MFEDFNTTYERVTTVIWKQVLDSANAHETLNKSGKSPEACELLNAIQFLQLSALDIMVIQKGLFNSKNSFELLFFARNTGTVLSEFNGDRNNIIGRNFDNLISSLNATTDEISTLRAIQKKLTSVLKPQEAYLKKIRNSLSSHRDHDTLNQIHILSSLNSLEIMKLLQEVFNWITEMNAFLIAILTRKLNS